MPEATTKTKRKKTTEAVAPEVSTPLRAPAELKRPKLEIRAIKPKAEVEASAPAAVIEPTPPAQPIIENVPTSTNASEPPAATVEQTEQKQEFWYELTGNANGEYDPEAGTFTCRWGTFPAKINRGKAKNLFIAITRKGNEFVTGMKGWVFYPCVNNQGIVEKVELVRFFNEPFPTDKEGIRACASVSKMDFQSRPICLTFAVKRNDKELGTLANGREWKRKFSIVGRFPNEKKLKLKPGQRWKMWMTITPDGLLAARTTEMVWEPKPKFKKEYTKPAPVEGAAGEKVPVGKPVVKRKDAVAEAVAS